MKVTAIKAHGERRRRGLAPFIVYLGTGWRTVVGFTFRPLYRREQSAR
jgi:hypothetical protein